MAIEQSRTSLPALLSIHQRLLHGPETPLCQHSPRKQNRNNAATLRASQCKNITESQCWPAPHVHAGLPRPDDRHSCLGVGNTFALLSTKHAHFTWLPLTAPALCEASTSLRRNPCRGFSLWSASIVEFSTISYFPQLVRKAPGTCRKRGAASLQHELWNQGLSKQEQNSKTEPTLPSRKKEIRCGQAESRMGPGSCVCRMVLHSTKIS